MPRTALLALPGTLFHLFSRTLHLGARAGRQNALLACCARATMARSRLCRRYHSATATTTTNVPTLSAAKDFTHAPIPPKEERHATASSRDYRCNMPLHAQERRCTPLTCLTYTGQAWRPRCRAAFRHGAGQAHWRGRDGNYARTCLYRAARYTPHTPHTAHSCHTTAGCRCIPHAPRTGATNTWRTFLLPSVTLSPRPRHLHRPLRRPYSRLIQTSGTGYQRERRRRAEGLACNILFYREMMGCSDALRTILCSELSTKTFSLSCIDVIFISGRENCALLFHACMAPHTMHISSTKRCEGENAEA